MASRKAEHAEKLFRSLLRREAELQASDELIRKETARNTSLRAAIADLRRTISALLEDAAPSPSLPPSEPQVQDVTPPQIPGRSDGTILSRVAGLLNSEARVFSAPEVALSLAIGIDVARTSLSKLYNRGDARRLEPGQYISRLYADPRDAKMIANRPGGRR